MKSTAFAVLMVFCLGGPATALTFTPGNLLMSYNNQITEYTRTGEIVQQIAVPSPTGESIVLRDLVLDEYNRLHVMSGPSIFDLYLSTLDLSDETWSHNTISGWSLGNVTYYGGIGISNNYIFAPDQSTGSGGGAAGIIRIPLDDLSSIERLPNSGGHAATVGLDGYLYTVERYGHVARIDPETMETTGTFNVYRDASVIGLAVAANGHIYSTDLDGDLHHFDSSGTFLEKVSGFGVELNLALDGTLVGTDRGTIDVTNIADLTTTTRIDAMQPFNIYQGFTIVVPDSPLYLPLPGDVDGDGDLDTADFTKALQNFTGEGGTGKTPAEGDTDFDGDVDTADLTTALQNFTGAWPDAAQLIYDPATGNVQLDARGAPGHVITQFALQNAAGGLDFNTGVASFPFPGSAPFDLPTLIATQDESGNGFSGAWDLGNIFPTGLNDSTLASFLTAATYAGDSGGGNSLPFELLVTSSSAVTVPEPSTFLLALLASMGGLALVRCGRRGTCE